MKIIRENNNGLIGPYRHDSMAGNSLIHDEFLQAKKDPATREAVMGKVRMKAYFVALRYTRSPEEAEDIAQEASMRVHQNFHRYGTKDQDNPNAWVHTIARNICNDHYRRRPKALVISLDEKDDGTEERTWRKRDIPDERNNIEDRLYLKECEEALASLPEKKGKAYFLSHLEGYKYDDIAAIARENINTVKGSIMRMRDQAKELFRERALVYNRE